MHMHMCMCMCMQELMRYETMVSLAQTQLKVPVVTAEVRRSAIDSFAKSRQATSNYGMHSAATLTRCRLAPRRWSGR